MDVSGAAKTTQRKRRRKRLLPKVAKCMDEATSMTKYCCLLPEGNSRFGVMKVTT